jgi:hypothetical protein
MSDWFEDHDNWSEQFSEFLQTHINEGNLTENDQMFISNLAAKVRRGDMGMHRAVHELMKYAAAQMGYLGFHDEESFDLEMRYQDMAEITEELQHWLLYVDEPGISNAIVRAYASLKILDEGANQADAHIGLHAKAWFDLTGMNKEEDEHFKYAVIAALKQRYGDQA